MSNYQNEAEIRDHVFGKEPLRPPHAARSRAQLYATGAIRGRPDMGWKAHATWHGLSSPWVWGGPYALRCPSSVVRRPSFAVSRPIRFLRLLRFFAANPPLSVLSRPPSVFRRQPSHPILASFAPLGGQPSAVRPQSSAVRLPPSAVKTCPSPSVLRRPIRFLRLLRFFATNPPLSVLSRPPSVFRRPSSVVRRPSSAVRPLLRSGTPFTDHRPSP